jgi:hypothetical protein
MVGNWDGNLNNVSLACLLHSLYIFHFDL